MSESYKKVQESFYSLSSPEVGEDLQSIMRTYGYEEVSEGFLSLVKVFCMRKNTVQPGRVTPSEYAMLTLIANSMNISIGKKAE